MKTLLTRLVLREFGERPGFGEFRDILRHRLAAGARHRKLVWLAIGLAVAALITTAMQLFDPYETWEVTAFGFLFSLLAFHGFLLVALLPMMVVGFIRFRGMQTLMEELTLTPVNPFVVPHALVARAMAPVAIGLLVYGGGLALLYGAVTITAMVTSPAVGILQLPNIPLMFLVSGAYVLLALRTCRLAAIQSAVASVRSPTGSMAGQLVNFVAGWLLTVMIQGMLTLSVMGFSLALTLPFTLRGSPLSPVFEWLALLSALGLAMFLSLVMRMMILGIEHQFLRDFLMVSWMGPSESGAQHRQRRRSLERVFPLWRAYYGMMEEEAAGLPPHRRRHTARYHQILGEIRDARTASAGNNSGSPSPAPGPHSAPSRVPAPADDRGQSSESP